MGKQIATWLCVRSGAVATISLVENIVTKKKKKTTNINKINDIPEDSETDSKYFIGSVETEHPPWITNIRNQRENSAIQD